MRYLDIPTYERKTSHKFWGQAGLKGRRGTSSRRASNNNLALLAGIRAIPIVRLAEVFAVKFSRFRRQSFIALKGSYSAQDFYPGTVLVFLQQNTWLKQKEGLPDKELINLNPGSILAITTANSAVSRLPQIQENAVLTTEQEKASVILTLTGNDFNQLAKLAKLSELDYTLLKGRVLPRFLSEVSWLQC